ncbi:MAG: tyrosine-type recombinase/integrase [Candidatus Margulisbacteria bacterium]|nr:tyrosine-type recombinase/integrase [Candidatus Margulisiibacteriota bacterium]
MPRRTARTAALPTYLEPQQIAALIEAAPTPQARVMMTLMWRSGLRVSEALAVRAADVRLDGEQPTLRVRHGKGGRPRMVPIHQALLPMLEGLRLYRDRAGQGPAQRLPPR